MLFCFFVFLQPKFRAQDAYRFLRTVEVAIRLTRSSNTTGLVKQYESLNAQINMITERHDKALSKPNEFTRYNILETFYLVNRRVMFMVFGWLLYTRQHFTRCTENSEKCEKSTIRVRHLVIRLRFKCVIFTFCSF